MTDHQITDKRATGLTIGEDDSVSVQYSGEIVTTGPSIVSTGNNNSFQIYGPVRSQEGTAIILRDGAYGYIGNIVEGKTGAIQIGTMAENGILTNVHRISASAGTAISGSGRLNIKNGLDYLTDFSNVLISGKTFGIDFSNGFGDSNNLKVENFGTIQGGDKAIRGSASNDVVDNYGVIQGLGGIAVSLGAGNDVYKGLANGSRNGVALGTIDMGEGDDKVYSGRGTDAIDGGTGTDTVFLSGKRSDYKVTQNPNGSFTIADMRAIGDGTDTALNVELFRFADGTFKATDFVSEQPPAQPPAQPPTQPPAESGLTLVGTKGKNKLVGGSGNDKIYGKSGNDVLVGGAGQDIFVFDTKPGTSKTDRKVNFDTIADFSVQDDTIWLDNKYFKKLGKGTEANPGKLNKKYFVMGTKAKDKNDYLVYEKKKGILSYDVDGSGSKYTPVEILKLSNKARLTADDFMII